MADTHDSDRETYTRILMAIAVNDIEPTPTRSEIDQLADEMIEWSHRLRDEFRRAALFDQFARLSRAEIEARLAARLVPAACCTQLASANAAEPTMFSDDDLRAQLVEAQTFIERMAA